MDQDYSVLRVVAVASGITLCMFLTAIAVDSIVWVIYKSVHHL